MRVLAFDCSSARGCVAVLDGREMIFSEGFDCPRGRGGELFPVLDRAVARTGTPDRIAVGIGPGSYNGLRVAIAAVEGLSMATGAERVGIVSLRALPCGRDGYLAVGDARGGAFYFARMVNREVAEGIELLPLDELRLRIAEFEGSPVFSPAPLPAVPEAVAAFPEAVILARLGMEANPEGGVLEPIYLKPAHITQPRR